MRVFWYTKQLVSGNCGVCFTCLLFPDKKGPSRRGEQRGEYKDAFL